MVGASRKVNTSGPACRDCSGRQRHQFGWLFQKSLHPTQAMNPDEFDDYAGALAAPSLLQGNSKRVKR
jgi:hypothetical protein